MKFDAVRVSSAPEVLADQIVRQIRSGELPPGACLPSQRELARMFRVGLGSVREAIKILNVMGYLEVIRGRGTYIAGDALEKKNELKDLKAALDAASLPEVMAARDIIECGTCRLAAEKAHGRMDRLYGVMKDIEAARDDLKAFFEIDFAFHAAVAEAVNNPVLSEITKLLVNRAHHYAALMRTATDAAFPFNVETALQTARDAAAAIYARDGAGAADAMSSHLNVITDEIQKEEKIQ